MMVVGVYVVCIFSVPFGVLFVVVVPFLLPATFLRAAVHSFCSCWRYAALCAVSQFCSLPLLFCTGVLLARCRYIRSGSSTFSTYFLAVVFFYLTTLVVLPRPAITTFIRLCLLHLLPLPYISSDIIVLEYIAPCCAQHVRCAAVRYLGSIEATIKTLCCSYYHIDSTYYTIFLLHRHYYCCQCCHLFFLYYIDIIYSIFSTILLVHSFRDHAITSSDFFWYSTTYLLLPLRPHYDRMTTLILYTPYIDVYSYHFSTNLFFFLLYHIVLLHTYVFELFFYFLYYTTSIGGGLYCWYISLLYAIPMVCIIYTLTLLFFIVIL